MLSHPHHKKPGEATAPKTQGVVMNWGWRYDLLIGVVTLSREHAFRQRIADLAQLQPGERVLDVGCGTGMLAIVAKERVGVTGRVSGIDPGPKQIARACSKAERTGLSIDFQLGVIEHLSFPDQSFDVVLSTFMMHHLPDDLKRLGYSEMARVLKSGGRLLVVDLKGLTADQLALMKEAGFSQLEVGKAMFFGFARARKS